jgi:HNH endonuclease
MCVLYGDMNESVLVHERLSDSQLLVEVNRRVASEREATATLVSALAEVDVRRLYLGQGCSSMFTYCTQVLHLAEHAAYNRIEAARAVHRFPMIRTLLADGWVHLSAIRLLSPHLTASNHRDVLLEASHKTKREIEEIVARLQPRPDVPPSVRRLPTAPIRPPARTTANDTPQSTAATTFITVDTSSRPKTEPLAPGRYKMQFTVTQDTYEKLLRVQDLLRHRVPKGDPAVIFDRALTVLLETLERQKLAATDRPRSAQPSAKHLRYIPAVVRRTVWARDGGRCRFEGSAGRCQETGFLEFHHVVPYASGGPTTAENLELRCAAHNRYEAEQEFGFFVREISPAWNELP